MRTFDRRRLTLAFGFVLLASGCGKSPPAESPSAEDPTFAGSRACRDCHATEFRDWQGSHHAAAMQLANEETVLGDFSNASFDYYGTVTRFVKDQGRYLVRSENAQGEIQDFAVTHTFGVEPLQQYLLGFPGGRQQALTIAWDTRPADAGGQRWYHLYPDERIAHDDPLHWTGRYFNWNYMCAECHSTSVVQGYDIGTDSFDTTFAETAVGCEACHGPGSLHISRAQSNRLNSGSGFPVDLDDRGDAAWIMNPASGIARRSAAIDRQQQPESCGRCHARRSVLAKDYQYGTLLTDTHVPSLLEERLYHADGRIQDEVYVYGSFLQSKMYAAGVTCSDCHNPHSGELHTGPDPNAVCTQCHLPTMFATPEHSGNDSVECVNCHMPAATYMGVDDRRDHSFRVPDAGAQASHYGVAIAAMRLGAPNAVAVNALQNKQHPAIARATLLTLLAPPAADADIAAIDEALNDADPLLRIAALRALRTIAPQHAMQSGSHLLRDPVRGVRTEAALTFAEFRDLLPVEDARAFAKAADEFREALRMSASMPEPVVQLAEFESRMGNDMAARSYLEHALRLDEALGLTRHAYGLLLVREGRADDALQQLRLAAELEPANSRFVYVYAIALNSLGHVTDALDVLARARRDFPRDFDIGWALATVLRDLGDLDGARSVANELLAGYPDNPNVLELSRALAPATE